MAQPNWFHNAQGVTIGKMKINNAARDSYTVNNRNVRNVYREGDQVHNQFINSNNSNNSTHNGNVYNGTPLYQGPVNNIGSVKNANFGINHGIMGQDRSFDEPRTNGPPPPPQGPQYGGQLGPQPSGGMGNGGYQGGNGGPPGPGAYTNSSPDFSQFQNHSQGQPQPQGPPPGQAPYPMNHAYTAPGRPQPNEAMNNQNPPIPSAYPPPTQLKTGTPAMNRLAALVLSAGDDSPKPSGNKSNDKDGQLHGPHAPADDSDDTDDDEESSDEAEQPKEEAEQPKGEAEQPKEETEQPKEEAEETKKRKKKRHFWKKFVWWKK